MTKQYLICKLFFEYLNSIYREKTWDTMKIITVQYVRIEPEYKLLYLHALNKFKLTLIDGSGHFTVTTNSSQIVQVSYIQNSREIYVDSNEMKDL